MGNKADKVDGLTQTQRYDNFATTYKNISGKSSENDKFLDVDIASNFWKESTKPFNREQLIGMRKKLQEKEFEVINDEFIEKKIPSLFGSTPKDSLYNKQLEIKKQLKTDIESDPFRAYLELQDYGVINKDIGWIDALDPENKIRNSNFFAEIGKTVIGGATNVINKAEEIIKTAEDTVETVEENWQIFLIGAGVILLIVIFK